MRRLAYTNPVNTPVSWPYVVTHPFDLRHFRWWIERYGEGVESVLYDAGVFYVFRGGRREYPPRYFAKYFHVLGEVERLRDRYAPQAELLYVIPDYPARLVPYPWNAVRTVEMVRSFLGHHVKRLPGTAIAVVQGGECAPASVVWSYLENQDVYDEFEILGLANVCNGNRPAASARELALFDRIVRRPYHGFGFSTRTIRYIVEHGISLCLLRSVDSSTYYFDWLYRTADKEDRDALARALLNRMTELQRLLDRIPCSSGRLRSIPLTELLSSGGLTQGTPVRSAPVEASPASV